MHIEEIEELEVAIYCHSEKEDASIGVGSTVNANKITVDNDYGLDLITLQESFWENFHQFEDGIERAKELVRINNNMSVRAAMKEVFGAIHCFLVINDVKNEIEKSFAIELENYVYSMLEASI